MRLHRSRHKEPSAELRLPDAATVYKTALELLTSWHESEAATYLALCRLEIVATGEIHPLRELLLPVRLVVIGSPAVVSALEQSAEVKGRVRQALDSALGGSIYLAQMAVVAGADALAA
jgi:hypothetical protein